MNVLTRENIIFALCVGGLIGIVLGTVINVARGEEKPETTELQVVRLTGHIHQNSHYNTKYSRYMGCYELRVYRDNNISGDIDEVYLLLVNSRVQEQFLGEAMINHRMLDMTRDAVRRRVVQIKGIVAQRAGEKYLMIVEIVSPTEEEVAADIRWLRDERAHLKAVKEAERAAAKNNDGKSPR